MGKETARYDDFGGKVLMLFKAGLSTSCQWICLFCLNFLFMYHFLYMYTWNICRFNLHVCLLDHSHTTFVFIASWSLIQNKTRDKNTTFLFVSMHVRSSAFFTPAIGRGEFLKYLLLVKGLQCWSLKACKSLWKIGPLSRPGKMTNYLQIFHIW